MNNRTTEIRSQDNSILIIRLPQRALSSRLTSHAHRPPPNLLNTTPYLGLPTLSIPCPSPSLTSQTFLKNINCLREDRNPCSQISILGPMPLFASPATSPQHAGQSPPTSRSSPPIKISSTWAAGDPNHSPSVNPALSPRSSSPSLNTAADPAAITAPIPERIFEPRPKPTKQEQPESELVDANPVAIPRLDTRKIAQLNRVALPDSVRTISSSRTMPSDPNGTTFSVLSQLNHSRPMTDRPTLSSSRGHSMTKKVREK